MKTVDLHLLSNSGERIVINVGVLDSGYRVVDGIVDDVPLGTGKPENGIWMTLK